MLKAVIFDFDGVISDSEPLHCKAFADTAKEFGFELSEQLYYSDYVGYCDRECFENMVKNFPQKLRNEDIDKMVELKCRLFEDLAKEKANILPGVEDFVLKLIANEIPIAICSGAILRDIELMLAGSKIENSFKIIVSDDDVAKGKPDPEGYIMALERLNEGRKEHIKAGNCVVIEDSCWGLMAGRAAGMKTIAVTNTYPADQLQLADMVVDNLGEITIAKLENLTK